MKLSSIKYFILAMIVVATGFFISPNSSFAISRDEMIKNILIQIGLLQNQLAQLQNSPDTSSEWCYTFEGNLKFGDLNKKVSSLQTAMTKEGFTVSDAELSARDSQSRGYFGESTASAVVGFQEKYKDEILTPNNLQHGTGFVGKATRTKLNQLYGCGKTHSSSSSSSDSSNSSITVLSPNGGETWAKGTTQVIKWQDNIPTPVCPPGAFCVSQAPRKYDIKLVSAQLPCDIYGCPAFNLDTIAKNVPGFLYEWDIGRCMDCNVVEMPYTIQVCIAGSNTCDSSNSYFKIVSGNSSSSSSNGSSSSSTISVSLLSPSGAKTYLQGDTIPVTWTSTGLISTDLMSVQLLNAEKKVVYSYLEKNTGSIFLVPESTMFYQPGQYYVRISPSKCGDGNCTNDVSSPNFTIANNPNINTNLISIISPTQDSVYDSTNPSIIVGWKALPWNLDFYRVYIGNTISNTELLLSTEQISRYSNGFVFTRDNLKSFWSNLDGKTVSQIKDGYYIRVKALKTIPGTETIVAEGKSGTFTIE